MLNSISVRGIRLVECTDKRFPNVPVENFLFIRFRARRLGRPLYFRPTLAPCNTERCISTPLVRNRAVNDRNNNPVVRGQHTDRCRLPRDGKKKLLGPVLKVVKILPTKPISSYVSGSTAKRSRSARCRELPNTYTRC